MEPAVALERLLRALGVPGEQIPAELDDRAALWRSVAAGKRLLLVLDNAATTAQARPLLPGTPGCLVVVTSRRDLVSLEPSYRIRLDALPVAEAWLGIQRCEYRQAIDAYRKAGEIAVALGDTSGEMKAAIGIGDLLMRQVQFGGGGRRGSWLSRNRWSHCGRPSRRIQPPAAGWQHQN